MLRLPTSSTLFPYTTLFRSMVDAVKQHAADWEYEAVTIGYPGPVLGGTIRSEPHNLGKGWVGFEDRKSTRLNSSHRTISYAVFCLKKKSNASIVLFSIRLPP